MQIRNLIHVVLVPIYLGCGVSDETPGDAEPDLSEQAVTNYKPPLIHVDGVGFRDGAGHEAVFRGVNIQGDAGQALYGQAGALGANFLRIVTHWDQAELTAPSGS